MSLQKKMLAGMIAAACSGMFATSAMAIMTYDLRFADGTKSKDAFAGDYVVNLYAVIDHGGDNSFATDSITGGQINIYSGSVGAGAIVPGTNSGVTGRSAMLPTPNFSLATTADQSGDLLRDANGAATPNNVADVPGDGILDWGADERYIVSGGGATAANPLLSAYHREGVQIAGATKTYNWRFTQPFVPGGAVIAGVSQPSNTRPNAWEVLVGSFTISLATTSATATPSDKTTFTPFSHHRIRSTSSAPSASGGSNYSTDGNLPGNNPGGVSSPYGEGAFSGVEFRGIIPEPSTYVLCGLAAAAGVFGLRRRKTS